MQNDPQSHGLWEKTAPPSPPTSALNGTMTADAVIVGGGFTGLSTALHLANQGLRPVVLEAIELGFGGSGRNVGLINGGMWVMPNDIPGVLGEVYGERCLQLLSEAPLLVRNLVADYAIDCEIEDKGTLHLAVGTQGVTELQERFRQWHARGAPLRLLDADETAQRTGSSAYQGALHDPRAGTLQPLAYVRGLAQAAMTLGARIYTHSPVTGYSQQGPDWQVQTPQGTVTAPWVVMATDAYSTGPFRMLREEQVHLPYFNLATAPLSDNLRKTILPQREGCWDTKEILSSFRMDRQGRLVFGSVGALRNTGHAIHEAWARRALRRIFPQLGDVAFETAWYGQIGMTRDAVPRFHRFGEQMIGMSGYNGRGIAPGTTFGRVLADHITGKISEADLPLPVTEPQAQPFRRIKEAYYEVGAQIAHLADERF